MRYLFIDDHHIERTEGLARCMHQPVKQPEPVLLPEEPWEGNRIGLWCAPIFEVESQSWKMWYWGDGLGTIEPLYAVSEDGLHWQRPKLHQVRFGEHSENNVIQSCTDGSENMLQVIRDGRDPVYPYKAATRSKRKQQPVVLLRSQDGRQWEPLDFTGPMSCDTYRFTYDQVGERYIMTVKHHGDRPDTYIRGTYPVPEYGRMVALHVSEDLRNWSEAEPIFAADEFDWHQGRVRIEQTVEAQGSLRQGPIFANDPQEYRTEVYSMPVFAYEDLYLALPEMFNTSGLFRDGRGRWKQNGLLYPELASSRDLLHWNRLGHRQPFLPLASAADDALDKGMLGLMPPILHADELWFYYQGSSAGHAMRLADQARQADTETYPNCGIFMAKLRRDGFVSMSAGQEPGVLLTQPLTITGSELCVNADAAKGELRVEIRDAYTGRAIPGYSLGTYYPHRFSAIELEQCADDVQAAPDSTVPLMQDSTQGMIGWKDRANVAELKGRVVRLQFYLRQAELFSFWFAEPSS